MNRLPNVSALGNERIEVARTAQDREEWKEMWKDSLHANPFKFQECWNQCMEYFVDDFPAEVGFYIDVLGFKANAFGEDYAMFTDEARSFYFSISPATEEHPATPPNGLRLQFMIQDIREVTEELERRGIRFEHRPGPESEGSPMYTGWFRTPNGIKVDLWGMIPMEEVTKTAGAAEV